MPFPIKIHEFSLQTELKWLYIFWWGNSLNTLLEGKSVKVELFMSTGRSQDFYPTKIFTYSPQ